MNLLKKMDPLRNKWLTVFLCSYEVTAILVKTFTGRELVPPVTRLAQRHPSLGVALTMAMGWHFAAARKEIAR